MGRPNSDLIWSPHALNHSGKVPVRADLSSLENWEGVTRPAYAKRGRLVTAPQTSPGVYSGTLYQTTGPAFNAVPFNPATVVATAVGTPTFTFSDGNNASFAYTVNGVAQMKAITRENLRGTWYGCASNPAVAQSLNVRFHSGSLGRPSMRQKADGRARVHRSSQRFIPADFGVL